MWAFHDAREAGKSPAETTRTEDDARVAEAMSGGGPRQSGRPKVINPYVKKGTQARRKRMRRATKPAEIEGLNVTCFPINP